ncbi:ParA family protein [Solemya velum gill symbiont]|uniref:Chromosome partitioning protein n=1 Tax=Solemya velum gill symbiont TaxID=2340 RepID=A0A1T2F1F2_SOVGS|nr:ParA family protein [Solemya velum gill symbiont]OOY35076.1 chromosome partitioning protein [Solemya velum gill symbiont]OOY37778.1 chromosome partitioning protein [Solemya velum gill symbiont]OOY40559.1 chromosome partitioning protein [Solemya velum gill symbiont]OOY47899.1 chromosome partitioning protein [Solemya velum gill symbiont]OOY48382.1 chromosome partitioning protein [Solemya velum gill symbiont]
MITVIGSLKGGSGKSTVTFNLAVWLSLAGQRTLGLDLDPQATFTDVADVRAEEGYQPGIEVRGRQALYDGTDLNSYKEILIDVGTSDMASLKRAIQIADRIIVPVPPSQADVWSTQRFVRFVNSIIANLENKPEVYGFLNRVDMQSAVNESYETAAALVSLPGIRFLIPRLSQRAVFLHSFSEGLAAMELDPRDPGVREFNALAAELYPHLVR